MNPRPVIAVPVGVFPRSACTISLLIFPDQAPGSIVGKFRCENLEALTFADESIDLHVTQDVLEHVFHPSKVFSEIARTLKPGGAHIFTVPLVNKHKPSKLRARVSDDGQIVHIEPLSIMVILSVMKVR